MPDTTSERDDFERLEKKAGLSLKKAQRRALTKLRNQLRNESKRKKLGSLGRYSQATPGRPKEKKVDLYYYVANEAIRICDPEERLGPGYNHDRDDRHKDDTSQAYSMLRNQDWNASSATAT